MPLFINSKRADFNLGRKVDLTNLFYHESLLELCRKLLCVQEEESQLLWLRKKKRTGKIQKRETQTSSR